MMSNFAKTAMYQNKHSVCSNPLSVNTKVYLKKYITPKINVF